MNVTQLKLFGGEDTIHFNVPLSVLTLEDYYNSIATQAVDIMIKNGVQPEDRKVILARILASTYAIDTPSFNEVYNRVNAIIEGGDNE
jgi:hypothetical protein